MSLKAFHLAFITVSIVLAVGFGAWAIRDFRIGGGAASLIAGVVSLVGAAAMLIYGRWFLRKLQRFSLL